MLKPGGAAMFSGEMSSLLVHPLSASALLHERLQAELQPATVGQGMRSPTQCDYPEAGATWLMALGVRSVGSPRQDQPHWRLP